MSFSPLPSFSLSISLGLKNDYANFLGGFRLPLWDPMGALA